VAQTPSEARAAKNEVSFRKANERLGEKRTELDAEGRTPFLCECSDVDCTQIVRLTHREYEHVRSNPTWFVIVSGHDAGVGTTAEDHGEYAIVEKTGIAGEIAAGEDPRQ